MTPALFEVLDEAGLTLWWDGHVLHYRAPLGAMTPALREVLRAARAELIVAAEARGGVLLPSDRRAWPAALRREFEAQLATLEQESRLPRAELERRAKARAGAAWLRARVEEEGGSP